MIMEAEVIEVSKDKGPFKQIRVKAHGHEFPVTVTESGGYHQSPMKGSWVTLAVPDDDWGRARVVGGGQSPAQRVDGQSEGEVTIKNHKTGNTIKVDKDGTITLTAAKIVLDGDIFLGSSGASRELALKDTTTTDGAANIGNLSTKVKAE